MTEKSVITKSGHVISLPKPKEITPEEQELAKARETVRDMFRQYDLDRTMPVQIPEDRQFHMEPDRDGTVTANIEIKYYDAKKILPAEGGTYMILRTPEDYERKHAIMLNGEMLIAQKVNFSIGLPWKHDRFLNDCYSEMEKDMEDTSHCWYDMDCIDGCVDFDIYEGVRYWAHPNIFF